MLTGRRAFEGDDVSDTLAERDASADPDWDALPADLPALASRLLRRCLQKDLKQRVHSIADVRLALDGAFETVASGATPVAVAQPLWRLRGASSAVSLAIGGLLVGFVARTLWPRTKPLPVNRFDYAMPTGKPSGARDAPPWRSLRTAGLSSSTRATDCTCAGWANGRPDWFRAPKRTRAVPSSPRTGNRSGLWASEMGQLKRIAITG